ncbi:hypothetical protein Tther_01672 [Tepidimonas thermarum]|uniref:Uncharacterized protein n=1 Tax=Tepidimonas thermarum TaxID=335431 RepID=A0A554WZY2_9BURK|nr:hypothetical protein Tther_01672 [Tepidimonas thermarum]
MVSSDLGKLEARRQRVVGTVCLLRSGGGGLGAPVLQFENFRARAPFGTGYPQDSSDILSQK